MRVALAGGLAEAATLVLAIAGLYGLVAYNVSRRTREIGIRMAIGAGPSDVLRLVMGKGLVLVGMGTVIGSQCAPTRRQNCVSLSSVIRCPFSRSRLISISFRPPSRPAACSGFGRPRTITVVWTEAIP